MLCLQIASLDILMYIPVLWPGFLAATGRKKDAGHLILIISSSLGQPSGAGFG